MSTDTNTQIVAMELEWVGQTLVGPVRLGKKG